MNHTVELQEICVRLDELARALTSGSAELVERKADALAAMGTPALERLLASLRPAASPAAPQDAPRQNLIAKLELIRGRAAQVKRLLTHGEQVRLGVTGILSLLYETQSGSHYSADGVPTLPSVHRILTEA